MTHKNLTHSSLLSLAFLSLLSGCSSGMFHPNPAEQARKTALLAKYPSPQYTSSWSCVSESDALQRLVEKIGVVVTSNVTTLTTQNDLRTHHTSRDRIGTQSIEQLRGLIVKRVSSHCYFLAVDPRKTKNMYTLAIKKEAQDLGRLFLVLSDTRKPALAKFRAAKKILATLQGLQADHDALDLLQNSSTARLRISPVHQTALKQALSFEISVREHHGDEDHGIENTRAELEVARDLLHLGYFPAKSYVNPAFKISIRFEKTLNLDDGRREYLVYVVAEIVDNGTGQTVRRLTTNYTQELGTTGFLRYNLPEYQPRAIQVILTDLLSSLRTPEGDNPLDQTEF